VHVWATLVAFKTKFPCCFKEKKFSMFTFLLWASYMQKVDKFEFSSFVEEIWFCLIFVDINYFTLNFSVQCCKTPQLDVAGTT